MKIINHVDAKGRRLPPTTGARDIAFTVYEVRIKRGLSAAVRAEGKANISELVGRRTYDWAAGRSVA